MKRRAKTSRSETSTLEKSKWKGVYFKNSLAALLALSAPEPPPSFLPLVLLLDLPLEPFFEVSADFSRCFLASFAILSIMWPDHVPSSDIACYQCSYPIETPSNTGGMKGIAAIVAKVSFHLIAAKRSSRKAARIV